MSTRHVTCLLCDGEKYEECRDCRGTGYSRHGNRPDDYGPHTKCAACRGTGRRKCDGCDGAGEVPDPLPRVSHSVEPREVSP